MICALTLIAARRILWYTRCRKQTWRMVIKTIYLMRHGETLFNVMDVNQGQCDSPLTENGMAIRRFLTALSAPQVNGFLGNCAIVHLTYENGIFKVEEVVDPNS